jgi:hypothetical protein
MKASHKRAISGAICAYLDLVFLPGSATAFTGKEHLDVSNFGMQIAVFRYEAPDLSARSRDDCVTPEVSELETLVSSGAVDAEQSFGNLVALVDQINAPESYFKSDVDTTSLPSKISDIDWKHIALLRKNPFGNLQALHLNDGHFQDKAIFRHLIWHRSAMDAARAGQLASALIFEAYADHFLEDFFAPGHIVTPRSSTGDMASLEMHDKYNRRALGFVVDEKSAATLLDMIKSIPDRELPIAGATLTLSEASLRALEDQLAKGLPISLKGDGTLKERGIETAFISVVVARSISDVLESMCGASATDHFESYRWNWPPRQGKVVGNAVGHYILPESSKLAQGHLDPTFDRPGSILVPSASLEVFPRGAVQEIRPAINLETLCWTLLVPEYSPSSARGGPSPLVFQSPSFLAGGAIAWDGHSQTYALVQRTISSGTL